MPPARELQAAKAQGDFPRGRSHAYADGLRSEAPDALRFGLDGRERLIDFAARHDPGGQISRVRNGDPPHAPVQRIVFVQLDFLRRGQRGHAVRGDRGTPARQKQSQSANRMALARAPSRDRARSGRTSGCRRWSLHPRSEKRRARHRLPNRDGPRPARRSPKSNGANPRTWPASPPFRPGNGRSGSGAGGREIVRGPRAGLRGRRRLRQIRVARGASVPKRTTSTTTRSRDSSATRTTRRTRLCCALQRCSSAASPCGRTSYRTPSSAASHSPFSRTSGAPVAQSPSRARCSSAASSMIADYMRFRGIDGKMSCFVPAGKSEIRSLKAT